jgi:hypothetical protein
MDPEEPGGPQRRSTRPRNTPADPYSKPPKKPTSRSDRVYGGSDGKKIDDATSAVLYEMDNINYLKLVDFVNDPRYKLKNDGSSIDKRIDPANITAGFITTLEGVSELDSLRASFPDMTLEDEADQEIPRDFIRMAKSRNKEEKQIVQNLPGAASGSLSVREGNIFFYPFTQEFDPISNPLETLPDIDTSLINYPIIQFPYQFNYGISNTLGILYIDPIRGGQSRLRLEVAGNIGNKPYFRVPYDRKNDETVFMYGIPVLYEDRPIRPHEDAQPAEFGRRRRKNKTGLKKLNAVIKYLESLKC